ncbi:hypothetical protein HZA38_05695 [Candidatus Peregrinibacteria bacterium]|nr:hypothetical protein [Candidatus Peregrinibacteria bacterium]
MSTDTPTSGPLDSDDQKDFDLVKRFVEDPLKLTPEEDRRAQVLAFTPDSEFSEYYEKLMKQKREQERRPGVFAAAKDRIRGDLERDLRQTLGINQINPSIIDEFLRTIEQIFSEEMKKVAEQKKAGSQRTSNYEMFTKACTQTGANPDDPYFLTIAARLLRYYLAEYAKRLNKESPLPDAEYKALRPDDIRRSSELSAATDEMSEHYPDMTKIVDLKYFFQLSSKKIAEALELSEQEIERKWTFARAYLLSKLQNKS